MMDEPDLLMSEPDSDYTIKGVIEEAHQDLDCYGHPDGFSLTIRVDGRYGEKLLRRLVGKHVRVTYVPPPDLVDELRAAEIGVCDRAADEIERLREENTQLQLWQ